LLCYQKDSKAIDYKKKKPDDPYWDINF